MRKTFILLSIFVLSGSLAGTVAAQTPTTGTTPAASSPVKLGLIQGDVSTINSEKIVLQTKDGEMQVTLSAKTTYFRVSPDNPSLKTATAANLTDIGAGDKLIVTGIIAADKKSVPAAKVYLMTKSDIAQKQNKEREEWQTRGITGQVAAINRQTKEITVSMRGMMGERKTILTPKENANFRRYAPDSVDYNEAKTSSIEEVKVGDSIRALGDKSEDGATIKAEKIVTGSFQTVGGTITAINAEKGEITINNVLTKKDVTIAVAKNSILKKFPAEMAQRMVQFQAMQAGGGITPGGGQGNGAVRPPRPARPAGQETAGQNPNRMGQGGGGMRGAANGNVDDMLERFPNIAIADLKVGEMIAVSSTKSGNAERINAIKLLSGVELFLKATQQQAAGRNGRGGQDSGFQIPGLDGSNFP